MTDANRAAATTWYRVAVIAGKGLNFPQADEQRAGPHRLRHRRRRAQLPALHRGLGRPDAQLPRIDRQLLPNRQAVGTYKCCDVVYEPPSRGYKFDTDFLTPALLPPRTPMFRDVNTLTFRQLLRPTQ